MQRSNLLRAIGVHFFFLPYLVVGGPNEHHLLFRSTSKVDATRNAASFRQACHDNTGETPLGAVLHVCRQKAMSIYGMAVAVAVRNAAKKQPDESNAQIANTKEVRSLHTAWEKLILSSTPGVRAGVMAP